MVAAAVYIVKLDEHVRSSAVDEHHCSSQLLLETNRHRLRPTGVESASSLLAKLTKTLVPAFQRTGSLGTQNNSMVPISSRYSRR